MLTIACIVVQTLHGESSLIFCGTESECTDWILALPESIQSQMKIYREL